MSFLADNFVQQLKLFYNLQPRKINKMIKANAGFFDGLVVKYNNNGDSVSV